MNIISLGGNCSVAYNFINLDKYNSRYPFDWCNVSINQLNKVLEDNFKDFENITIKKKSNKHPVFDCKDIGESLILKNKYNIIFAHMILESYEIDDFKIKIKKRIERFKSVKNPIFVRLETRNHDNKFLVNSYKKLFNNLKKYHENFKLIVIINKNLGFNHKDIQFVYFEKFDENWKYPNIDWNNII